MRLLPRGGNGNTQDEGKPAQQDQGLSEVSHGPVEVREPVTWPPVGRTELGTHTPKLAVHSAWTCAKESAHETSNEDWAAFNSETQRAVIVDGATESFAPRRWAKILVKEWALSNPNWFTDSVRLHEEQLESNELGWAQEAASARGSFATFTAIEPIQGGLQAILIGDSCVLLIAEDIVTSFPYNNVVEFNSAPIALGTQPEQQGAYLNLIQENTGIIPVAPNIRHIILATDAISAWLLEPGHGRERVRKVLSVTSANDFRDIVHAERSAGNLKTDDSTVLILNVTA